MGVSDPDLSIDPTDVMTFTNNFEESPLVINKAFSIASKKEITLDLNGPVSAIRFSEKTSQFAVATEDYGLYLSNKSLDKVERHFVLDELYFPVILNFVGVDFMGDNIKVMGYNKAFITVKADDKADDVVGFKDFKEGADKFTKIERSMFSTVRSKTSYIDAFVADEKYSYAITVPSNLNKNFVLMKQLNSDGQLSAELTPEMGAGVSLKKDRTLGELYTTALAYKDGKLYAASKNFNTIVVIDTKTDLVVDTISFPKEIKNIRALSFVGNELYAVSYQDDKNMLYILK